MWTLEEATSLVKELWPLLEKNGWHVAITGSVILNGKSNNDLDLVFYPRDNNLVDRYKLYNILEFSFGMIRKHDVIVVHKAWNRLGSNDRKHVEVWETKDKRKVDLFILS